MAHETVAPPRPSTEQAAKTQGVLGRKLARLMNKVGDIFHIGAGNRHVAELRAHIAELRRERDEAIDELAAAKVETLKLQLKKTAAWERIDAESSLRDRADKLDEEIEDLSSKLRNSQDQISALRQELQDAQGRYALLAQQQDEIKKKLSAANFELQQWYDWKSKAWDTARKMTKCEAELRDQLADLEQDYELAQEELEELRGEQAESGPEEDAGGEGSPTYDVTHLLSLLNIESAAVRTKALDALCKMEPKPTAQLASLVNQQNGYGKMSIAVALGRFADEDGLPALAELAEDASPSVRRAALIALAKFPRTDVLEIITSHLGDPDEEVAEEALKQQKFMLQHPLTEPALGAELAALEHQKGEPEDSVTPLAITGVNTLQPDDATPERVAEMVFLILLLHGSLDRRLLIRQVSERFGRAYLKRVRRFVNRYVFGCVARGSMSISGDSISFR